MTFVPKIDMRFFATECPDGTIHVQNIVAGYKGQHHVHSKESFERWRKGKDVVIEKGTCDCGLKAGDCREYDGHVWHSKKWE